MTIDDLLAREAIRHVMAWYTTAGDRLQVDDFVACFTPDAVIESEHVPPERTFRYEGAPAIRAWQQRWRSGEGATHGATFVLHHLSTSRIDLTGDDAGYYLDRFRKLDGEWRISHRRVRLDWESPESLFRSAVANSQA